MKAVVQEVPQALLDERRRTGLDRYDEMWEGVLHLAAAPRNRHQRLVTHIIVALDPLARAGGLEVSDGINVCDPADPHRDYRIPDVVVVDPAAAVVGDDFGRSEGIVMAVEIRAPQDETYDKLAFYAARGIDEVLVLDPAIPSVELLRLGPAATYQRASPSAEGTVVTAIGLSVRPSPNLPDGFELSSA